MPPRAGESPLRELDRRARTWYQEQRASGLSASATLLRALPGEGARRARRAATRLVHRALTRLRSGEYAARVRAAVGGLSSNPSVVVATPGTLHFLLPVVRLAERCSPVVLVLNGLPAWEVGVVRREFPELPTIALDSFAGSLVPHDEVVDLLIRTSPRDLVLLDSDFFLFDADAFHELAPRPGEAMVGYWGYRNLRTGILFPTTHLLALDLRSLREVMRRHGISARTRRRAPAALRPKLAELGLGDGFYPKEYIRWYDTLNLMMAASLADGYALRVLGGTEAGAFHVGGAAHRGRDVWLDHLNQRLLALPAFESFAARYRDRWRVADSIADGRKRLVEVWDEEVARRLDANVERIAGVLAAPRRG